MDRSKDHVHLYSHSNTDWKVYKLFKIYALLHWSAILICRNVKLVATHYSYWKIYILYLCTFSVSLILNISFQPCLYLKSKYKT